MPRMRRGAGTVKIVFDEKSGGYYAYAKSERNPCLAFSESREEAMVFCFELVQANDQLKEQMPVICNGAP